METAAESHATDVMGGSDTVQPATEDIPFDYEVNEDGESVGESLELSDSDEDELKVEAEEKLTWTDQVRMIHMRRYLNELADKVEHKDHELQKLRAAEDRLYAHFERLCEEIDNEKNLEEKIMKAIKNAEFELAEVQVEQGKMILVEDDLKKQEEKWARERTEVAEVRQMKETRYANQSMARLKSEHRLAQIALDEQRRKHKKTVDGAKRSQEKHKKHLQQTVDKIRQRESEEEDRQKAHMEKRMNTMLALKTDITANRENLRALRARNRAMEKKQKEAENQWCSNIEKNGGNPSEEVLKKRLQEQLEREKAEHEVKQKEQQVKIVERLLSEEDRMQRRKVQQPFLFTNQQKEKEKNVKPLPKRELKILDRAINSGSSKRTLQIDRTKFDGKTGDESGDEGMDYAPMSVTRDNTQIPDSDSDDEVVNVATNLAVPEFEGVWDNHKAYRAPKDLVNIRKLPDSTKMERDIMDRVMDKHREGIVINQVAGGREFQGCAFYSKPDVVHFKDFEVGKTYKKRVILTNVSYTVNYCKLTGLTEHLKDFITLSFDPPGQMSAGLTCELNVTFKPMINEDLTGFIHFLAQTGPFKIPLKCSTKKCNLSVDKDEVDFGTSVIGETLSRSITLSNKGALPTKFDFYKITADTVRGNLSASVDESVAKVTKAEEEKGKEKDEEKQEMDEKEVEKEDDIAAFDGRSEVEEGITIAESKVDIGQCDDVFSEDFNLNPEMDELFSLDGMQVGQVTEGTIQPFSSVKLDVVWHPTIPGKVNTEFAIVFQDPDSENINIQFKANAIDVPVWVERQNVDLKICTYDRLFQDTIIVNNRATTALRLKFEVCKELRNHLELLPKTGYIQAQSQFSAQLKFIPRKNIAEEAGQFFDPDTGVLEAPMTIRVADQTCPVPFTVHAVVTNSDIEFSTMNIDFGCATIHEAVKKTVTFTNKSILPQQFGFVGIPSYIDVQPNDGFGTLLPKETIDLDIIFQPRKAQQFNFDLTCKSLINREFKIRCTGTGVHPPVELSTQVIHFPATAINDVSSAAIHVINSHLDMNEFSHPVPRIGKGEIAPVGPTSFEFLVPKESPISISPAVGTILPGQKCRVHVRFSPEMNDSDVRQEAVRMITKTLEHKAQEEYQAALLREKEEELNPKGKGKQNAKDAKQAKGGGKAAPKEGDGRASTKGPSPVQSPDSEDIDPRSDEYCAAAASLVRQYNSQFNSFVIPCHVASGKCSHPGELDYSVHNTLFLEVHCPAIRPKLVVISDNGRASTDFGEVSIGQNFIRTITIQNISSGSLEFQETLEIRCPNSCLSITLKGKGVSPVVTLSVENNIMDMGAVIEGEYQEDSFKIVNTSTLAVRYAIKLDSQSLLRHAKSQELPSFVTRSEKTKCLVGTQNNNGQQVFDCVPAEGNIAA
ncbi:hypothetical protein CAPTEDRAFT_225037, partial [Capitella teleta]